MFKLPWGVRAPALARPDGNGGPLKARDPGQPHSCPGVFPGGNIQKDMGNLQFPEEITVIQCLFSGEL